MDCLQIFSNPNFGKIRTANINGEPWFSAFDVCAALDVGNPSQALTRLDEDERCTTLISNEGAASGKSQMAFVNESGLYSLVLGSRKPEAKAFKRWVTHEVIPTIRKTGGFVNNEEAFVATYLPFADDQTKTMFAAILQNVRTLNQKIEQDKPKVLFADAVSASTTSILIGELAKVLKQNGVNIGQQRMFAWLRENGYLIKSGSSKNIPTQRAMESGLFEIKEGSYVDGNGNNVTTRTSKVTGKGQLYFANKFLKEV